MEVLQNTCSVGTDHSILKPMDEVQVVPRSQWFTEDGPEPFSEFLSGRDGICEVSNLGAYQRARTALLPALEYDAHHAVGLAVVSGMLGPDHSVTVSQAASNSAFC